MVKIILFPLFDIFMYVLMRNASKLERF